MSTLLSGLYKYMFQKDEYCVLILGLDNAGKTVSAAPCQRHPPPPPSFRCFFSCVFSTQAGSEPGLRS